MEIHTKELLPGSRENFRLSKWYADCVSDSGDVLIAYYGLARWRRIVIHYSSLVELIGDRPARARYSIRKCPAPAFDGETLTWKSKPLNFAGSWKSINTGEVKTVFSSQDRTVEWNCLQPRARAEIRFDGNRTFNGLGYSERMEMTIAPWKIPIQKLYWGRFLSATDSLVWMDWRGPYAKRILLHNGVNVNGEVTDGSILFGAQGKLTFEDRAVLRTGALGSTALAAIPGVRNLLPRRILTVDETKWRSRAELRQNTGVSQGWAIHEVVTWPQ